jgi:hypothetical protein
MSLHGVTTQNNNNVILIAMRTLTLTVYYSDTKTHNTKAEVEQCFASQATSSVKDDKGASTTVRKHF